jgi:formiminotetrahydrofolate cyclodeaminase/Zn-dependent peptidase ImmA (M78 family)
MDKLLELPTGELLQRFGKGNHKPGSGSAAALQGMLAAQLIRTVISLTTDEKRKENYKEWIPEMLRMDLEIQQRINPQLQILFQQDSEQFDKVFKLRVARDFERDPVRKAELKDLANQALKPATETVIDIGRLCAELSQFAQLMFENGFKAVRGDSGVALHDATSAIGGCLSIINLNLLSFGFEDWTEKTRFAAKNLKKEYEVHSLKTNECLQILEEEVEKNRLYHLEVNELRSNLWVGLSMANSDIERIVRRVQNTLWIYRDIIWKKDTPNNPIELLQPDVVLKKILGYKFSRSDTLGQHIVNEDLFEIAGIIDKERKVVEVSKSFPLETQNFTVAHELGHAFMHRQTVLHRDKAIDGSALRNSREDIEVQADKFAVYFLMPKTQVESIFEELFLVKKIVITENTVSSLNVGSVSEFRRKCKDLRGLSIAIASAQYASGRKFMCLAEIFHVSIKTMAIRLEELNLVEF